jgi:hypothetical protein
LRREANRKDTCQVCVIIILVNSENEEFHKKKKGNRSWTNFSILLIIINLLFVWLYHFIFLLPLAIIDFISAIYFIRKKLPSWKTFLISLFALNVIFFSLAG